MNDTKLTFNLPKDDTSKSSIIKVMGIGGGGGNAVTRMYESKIEGVSYLLINTDKKALEGSSIPESEKLAIAKLGAGDEPEKAKKYAEESADLIRDRLNDGTEMVFVAAGMGGGTGTGAAPIVAKIAKDMGILTVGVVTIPFLFEGKKKIYQALDGVEAISKNVDALIVVNNEQLNTLYTFKKTKISEAYQKVDETLSTAVTTIVEIDQSIGYINIDFADIKTILKNGKIALISSGEGQGEHRLEEAIRNAINSPLLNNKDLFKARKILFNIYFSKEHEILVNEMNVIKNKFMTSFQKEKVEVIWGFVYDDSLGDKIKFSLLASGYELDNIPQIKDKHNAETDEKTLEREKIFNEFYNIEPAAPIVEPLSDNTKKNEEAENASTTSDNASKKLSWKEKIEDILTKLTEVN